MDARMDARMSQQATDGLFGEPDFGEKHTTAWMQEVEQRRSSCRGNP